jgi:nitroimidazol reductase NimA-like FMN-containing flavoprotein (pyridoxamine 5'-phosphate oxidase superfamily)
MRTRTISDHNEIEAIILKCQWCHVAMVDPDGFPYLLPMNFGFSNGTIYLHGAHHGKKIETLLNNPNVCINFSTDHLLRYQSEEVACSWSMKYRSVLCYGQVEFITDPDAKVKALDIIMGQYASREFKYNPPSLREVNVFVVVVKKFEGRAFGM